MSMTRPTKTIKQTVFLPAKPAQVYEALLDAKVHSAFTGSRATCNRRTGGKFSAYDGYIQGTIKNLEADRRIVQEWQTTEWPEGAPPSTVEFTFKAKDDGTELTMVHSEVPEEQAESYRQGWTEYYWNPLKEYFGRGRSQ